MVRAALGFGLWLMRDSTASLWLRGIRTGGRCEQRTAGSSSHTGQRPAAAFAMKHDDFYDEWMRVIDEKSDEQFETYCPEPLRDFIASCPRKGKFILAKNLTEAVGYDAVEKAFREWRSTLGPEAKEFVLHGLRKLAIVRLAEAGCSDAEIQAVTNQSAEMVAYYRKKASRKILSKQAQHRRH
jgi:hypothetical protein